MADLDFPQNPLDAIIGHFGVGNVSGNQRPDASLRAMGKYVRRKLNRRATPDSSTNTKRDCFKRGTKRIAIISGAGSTGISVHADNGPRIKSAVCSTLFNYPGRPISRCRPLVGCIARIRVLGAGDSTGAAWTWPARSG